MAPYVYIPGTEQAGHEKALDAERLLRGLGVTGRLVGFRYAVFMVERVVENPDQILLITKRLYPETGRCFGVSAGSVERAVRNLIRFCWDWTDHGYLEHIAGTPLQRVPTNSDFIDMLAGYLRQLR